jgi:glutamate 5-kinase
MFPGSYSRIVIKVGSSLLVDRQAGLRKPWLSALAEDVAALRRDGRDVIVVSSGAIALGRTLLGLGLRDLRLEESQAAAAVGQIALSRAWSETLGQEGLATGQVLVTLEDTSTRRRYLNARATVETLLKLGAVPVVNENDTVATSEIRYGDNDRLAARVATMIGADLLILLSDVDGLYTASPALDPAASHIPEVAEITPQIDAMAGGAASVLSRGGMRTKIEAGKIATQAGTAMIITSGLTNHPIRLLGEGAKSTLFHASAEPVSAYKSWIAGQAKPAGTLTVDTGAINALRTGKSLLAAGVRKVAGSFDRGDTIAICDDSGSEIARGLAAYDAGEARLIAGKKSGEIEAILGYAPRAAMVHRDDLVLR